ncbi:hypothetical protein EDE08_113176 [Bradyrhizobium sp. R2.2-H]|jgi:hypothetical protein|uniref:hypothetical protein n=1 Tax=unclassified Bradyrhizobium TaxID=2631580 RepID=UPI0010E542F3|nr:MULTISPECIES: hypothetical protein [unclassified Bradyrhizobium]TCU65562.1 hypothetical protein EDE10_113176 [Bradyrhizobium sp. Y-H1]TCU67709.1 hypothetical protein EDE08_113176 [Bradyrhizobium sp. R2.2-H]
MGKAIYSLIKRTPPGLVYALFLLLLMLATAPAFRIVLFGLSLDDVLQLRCFGSI